MANIACFRKTKVLIIVLLYLFISLLSACWNQIEVNDLALVMAAGIDQEKDESIKVSVQIIVPEPSGTGQGLGGGGGSEVQQTIVKTAKGTTIVEAMSKLQEKVPRRLFWGHNKVIIIGEDFAKEGIREQIDFFVRAPQTRLRIHLFVSKGSASNILAVLPPLEQSSAAVLSELAKLQIGMRVTLRDLLVMLKSAEQAAVLPLIEVPPPEPGQDEKRTAIRLNGASVFKKDKMIEYMDRELLNGILWVRDEVEKRTITFKPKKSKGPISFKIIKSNTKLIPEIINNRWKMTVKIESESNIEQNGSNLDVMNPEVVAKLEKQLEQEINDQIKDSLHLIQKDLKTDIIGFSETFHKKYPRKWLKVKDQWDRTFSEVEVVINSNMHIRRPGKATLPSGVTEKEVKNQYD